MNSMRRMFLILSLLLPVTVLASGVASAETKLAATIFSYDGADFVRTQTTLTQDGQSAVNTKLDHDSAAPLMRLSVFVRGVLYERLRWKPRQKRRSS